MTNKYYGKKTTNIEENELDSKKAKDILNDTLKNCDDGELYIEKSHNESFTYDDNNLKDASFSGTNGFGLRAVKNETTGFSHSVT